MIALRQLLGQRLAIHSELGEPNLGGRRCPSSPSVSAAIVA